MIGFGWLLFVFLKSRGLPTERYLCVGFRQSVTTREVPLKCQDNFAGAFPRFKVTGRLHDIYGRKRLSHKCSIFLSSSECDNFIVVLPSTFGRL